MEELFMVYNTKYVYVTQESINCINNLFSIICFIIVIVQQQKRI